LEKARIAGGWAGLYEISPDNHAILGEVPEVEGLILANGSVAMDFSTARCRKGDCRVDHRGRGEND